MSRELNAVVRLHNKGNRAGQFLSPASAELECFDSRRIRKSPTAALFRGGSKMD